MPDRRASYPWHSWGGARKLRRQRGRSSEATTPAELGSYNARKSISSYRTYGLFLLAGAMRESLETRCPCTATGGARKLQHPASILPAGAVQCEHGDETAVAPCGTVGAELGSFDASGARKLRRTKFDFQLPNGRTLSPRKGDAVRAWRQDGRAQLGRSSEATTPSLDSPRWGGAV